ncbi:LTA synthase family protein [Gilvimarinus sp. SDUM040013]|uniref:LTA synthase family protein n=1 Tax=Gilvimarinus gilvus TaxID=3058038 RepID=A0ABU4S108_9GAMM|nr:LTA synthase family protein [Gilvimarinus sp. SDUM040013]MDO3387214.1 LTA synthase family protein [Gilvimarinus sp. SDUM040013]MDX6850777.1 LTA synthase family protein [Gilvimarinus sp. SDUM040013]
MLSRPVLIITFALTLCAAALLADPSINFSSSPLKLAANCTPVILAYILALGLTRRPLTAAVVCTAVLFLIFSAHHLKLSHLSQPLIFADAFLAPQTITNWDLLSEYAPIGALITLGLVLLIAVAISRFERPQPWWQGALLVLIGAVGLFTISHPLDATSPLYGDRAHGAKPWATEAIAQDQGLMASLVSGARSTKFDLPSVDHALIDDFVASLPPQTTALGAPAIKPDIVLWLGESFFDPSIIAGVDRCHYLPELCYMLQSTEEQSVIDVPTFGGNTTRTEFEVLTAIPYHDLGTKDYPYMSIVRQQHSSIAWSLARLGYTTTAIHPNNASMWQRNRAMPLLGFDQFFSKQDFKSPKREGIFISDSTLLNQVTKTLEQDNSPQFIMAISMEGHGPFVKRDVLDTQRRDGIEAPSELDAKAAEEWREYIYHAQNAMTQMQRLQEYIKNRERPTLVVFFGDHLPKLKHIYKQITFVDGRADWQQDTPAFAFANFPISSRWKPTASHQLGVWALELTGLSPYTQYALLNEALASIASDPTKQDATVKALQLRQLYAKAEQAIK